MKSLISGMQFHNDIVILWFWGYKSDLSTKLQAPVVTSKKNETSVCYFATFEGCLLDPSNAECFVGEPRMSVLNSSNCCKMFSLSNDT